MDIRYKGFAMGVREVCLKTSEECFFLELSELAVVGCEVEEVVREESSFYFE